MSSPSFMQFALEEARTAQARGEVPVGCVVVRDGEVIARAGNRTIIDRDPTAHAELLAIRQAAAALGSERLSDCDLYVTLEPCTMCTAAAPPIRKAARWNMACGFFRKRPVITGRRSMAGSVKARARRCSRISSRPDVSRAPFVPACAGMDGVDVTAPLYACRANSHALVASGRIISALAGANSDVAVPSRTRPIMPCKMAAMRKKL